MPRHGFIQKRPNNTQEALLYNYYAVSDARLLAPVGYGIATQDDWADLLGYLGGADVAGGKLKALIGFNEPNTGATDEVGFSAVSTGKRNADGTFESKGTNSYHWIKNTNE